jgi:flavin reductase (DIM6/NTAB) family NADH-FMN oxidoreductase RutF
MTIEPRRFRDTLGRVPTGVCVITTADGNGDMYGATIGSFGSLSLDPPLVLFSLDKSALCHPAFIECKGFVVNVLAQDQTDLSRIFASRDPRPWHDLKFVRGSHSNAPVMAGAVAWIECDKEAMHPGGDHTIFIGRVVDMEQAVDGRPLLYFGGAYHRIEMATQD